jgi:hypothetical protein
VNNLTQGVYLFELKVTDSGGLISRDTLSVSIVQIPTSTCEPLNRPIINAQLIPIGNLSIGRYQMATAFTGGKVFFAGGSSGQGHTSNSGPTSTVIDIYDAITDSWSTSTLNVPKAFHAAIFKNGKIYWAGGATYMNYQGGIGNEDLITCEVEIRDVNTQVSSFTNLSFPKYCNEVFERDNRIWFVSLYSGWQNWQHFDIYDLASGNWLVGVLPQPISSYTSIISANNTIYIAGGYVNGVVSNQVWKLEF